MPSEVESVVPNALSGEQESNSALGITLSTSKPLDHE
jgi:hypothetical protein